MFPYRAPILYIRGRAYPVKVFHLAEPTGEDKAALALKQCLYLHVRMPPGDILVFMPGSLTGTDLTSFAPLITRFDTGQEEIDGLVKQLLQLSQDLPPNTDKVRPWRIAICLAQSSRMTRADTSSSSLPQSFRCEAKGGLQREQSPPP